MLSPVSPIDLSREAKFFWLLLLPSIALVYFSFIYAISTWKKLDERGNALVQQQYECQKDSDSYALFLHDYKLLYSKTDNEDVKHQLAIKIIEYKNLKYQNKIEAEYLQWRISEHQADSKKPIRQIVFFISTAFLIGYLSIVLLFILLKIQYKNTKVYKECQSCERTIDLIIMNYGTERDGTFSRCFCNQCYKDGEFTEPLVTLEEMKQKVLKEMIKKGTLPYVIERKVNRIYKLKRWQITSNY